MQSILKSNIALIFALVTHKKECALHILRLLPGIRRELPVIVLVGGGMRSINLKSAAVRSRGALFVQWKLEEFPIA